MNNCEKPLLPSKVGVFISLYEARSDVPEILLNPGHGTEIIQFAVIEFESILQSLFVHLFFFRSPAEHKTLIKVEHSQGHSPNHWLHLERIPVDQPVNRQRNSPITDDRRALIIVPAIGVS